MRDEGLRQAVEVELRYVFDTLLPDFLDKIMRAADSLPIGGYFGESTDVRDIVRQRET